MKILNQWIKYGIESVLKYILPTKYTHRTVAC